MPIFIPLMCLLAMGVARFRGPAEAVPADPAACADVPGRLLRWAVCLLPAQRAEWGQAMLGELACIDGRGRRWRFAAGCAGAAVLLPPWGRATAAVAAIAAVAVASAGLYASVSARYELGGWSWVSAAGVLVLLAGYALVASVLLRQPGVAGPGLLGGLLIAVAWLAPQYTFYDFIVRVAPLRAALLQVIVVPVLVGMIGTLWGGSAAAGRRIARLAAISAGLYVFLYGTIAVAVIGAAGAQIDATWTVSANVDDRLSNNVVFYLWFLPLTTAALAWAAAAATTRLHPRLAAAVSVTVASLPATMPAPADTASRAPVTASPEAGQAARPGSGRRTARLLLWWAIALAVVLGIAYGMLAS